jgi:hypothetical protein
VVLLRYILAVVTDLLRRINAEDAGRISAVILSDDVSDDDSNDDGTECDGDYVELSSGVPRIFFRVGGFNKSS